ncbi:DUF6455 family protein [Lutimaribacter saemankumensis]|uniref:DUF6455 family protein n=1 Tax=Lutimaribacter saemankumensis TaxID=490829 RepID=UPI003CCC42A9
MSSINGGSRNLALTYRKPDQEDVETRVGLWRRMLSVLGIDLPKRRLPRAVEDEVRESMINCQKCEHTIDCMKWLEDPTDIASPLEFCLNREIFPRLAAAQ